MISSFRTDAARDIYDGEESKAARHVPLTVWGAARRKLDLLNAARSLQDLKAPPANRLEALKGDLRGKYSIRINDQYRLVFEFHDSNAYDVDIVDYH